MCIPNLALLVDLFLKRIMPRTINVLSKRAIMKLGLKQLPNQYWARLMVLGNLPKDIINSAIHKKAAFIRQECFHATL